MRIDFDVDGIDDLRGELSRLFNLPDGVVGFVAHSGAFNASGQRYEHWVQGAETQTDRHEATGWPTTETVKGVRQDEISKNLTRVVVAIADGRRASMKTAVEDALKMMTNDLRQYPPEPAGSRYIRTGELRSGWGWEVLI